MNIKNIEMSRCLSGHELPKTLASQANVELYDLHE